MTYLLDLTYSLTYDTFEFDYTSGGWRRNRGIGARVDVDVVGLPTRLGLTHVVIFQV